MSEKPFIAKPITPCGRIGYREEGDGLWMQMRDRDGTPSTSYTHYHDVRRSTCPICKKGWEATYDSMTDQIRLESIKAYAHHTCFIGHLNLNEHSLIWGAILNSPNYAAPVEFDVIPNQYGGAFNTNWYRVSFKHLPEVEIIFGSRKRVWSIEFKGLKFLQQKYDFKTIFKDEETTKEGGDTDYSDKFLIHAWTKEKVKQYINEFKKIVAIERALKSLRWMGQFRFMDKEWRDKTRFAQVRSIKGKEVVCRIYPWYDKDNKEPYDLTYNLDTLTLNAQQLQIEADYSEVPNK